ncbi:hypothetical protein H2O64_18230 [Kordia sp. YSTF-M3]|uniref:Bacteriocin n=1 Tax=Kordia aestuariivivens TaxID=2759037 RepID=A0ABR7QDH8_9FLAO|nr:hypothetical protein [Kordia aestuariivivens]MBC8756616.1 hypothetical protein [Kordia aestuariivivens]
MKILNLKNTKNLSRAEMREIVAGFGEASLSDEDATVLCNDETSHTISSCDEMDAACEGRGGAKICSGGGN